MLAGHTVPRHYPPSQSDPLTSYSSVGWQCSPAAQLRGTTLHLGRIHLHTKAAKEGSVTGLPSSHSISVGFTYELQQRGMALLAGHSATRHYPPSRSDTLTRYRSEEGEC